MIVSDEGHGDEHDNHGHEGHEHTDSFVPESVVDPHRLHVVREATRAALGSERDRYEPVLAGLEQRIADLDRIIDRARWLPFGELDALRAFDEWLEQQPAPDPDRRHPTHDAVRMGTVVNWEPVLDLHIEAAYAAGRDDGLRRTFVAKAGAAVAELASLIDPLHHFAREYLDGRLRSDKLLEVLDKLHRGGTLPRFPSGTDECLSAIGGVMRSSGSALARSMSAMAVDANTGRIARIVPPRLCAPGGVVLESAPSAPFDVQQPTGTGVFVGNVELVVDSWAPDRIVLSVPEQAASGYVHVRGRADANGAIGSAIEEDLAALGACPMFAGGIIGRGSALAKAYLGLPATVQPLERPLYQRPEAYLTVRHRPVIVRFVAQDDRGRQINGVNPARACTPVTISWAVVSDTADAPQIDIVRDDGVALFRGLEPMGSRKIHPRAFQRLTLTAGSSCGSDVDEIAVEVRAPEMTVEADWITVRPGQSAALRFRLSCPVLADTVVNLVSEDPSRAVVTPSVTIPAGAREGVATVGGVAPGPAERATTRVSLTTAGHPRRWVDIWVENPLGEWSLVPDPADPAAPLTLAMLAIHAYLLPTGKVLFFAGDENDPNALDKVKIVLWDPPTGDVTDISATMPVPRNLFCSGHAFLADGRLLIAGGHAHSPPHDLREEIIGAILGGISGGAGVGGPVGGALIGLAIGRGVDHDVHVFDPGRTRWSRHRDMAKARWYPTCVTLPDGKVLIVSGYCAGAPPHPFTLFGAPVNEDYDMFDPATGDLMQIRSPRFLAGIDLYPRLHVLPGGVLFVHSRNRTVLFYPDGTAPGPLGMTPSAISYLTRSPHRRTYPVQGACVLLPLLPGRPGVRLLVVGGGNEVNTTISWTNPATHTAEIFDFDPALDSATAQSGWRDTRDDGTSLATNQRRFMSDAVLMPDRTVLVVGGADTGRDDYNSGPVFTTMSFDSDTETWSRLAPSTVERRYHSTALLLPDGRVVTAGSSGGWPGPPWESEHPFNPQYTLERFTPPYLFRGPRPKLTSLAVRRLVRGGRLEVGTDVPQDIGSVVLRRPNGVTHTADMDHRHVELEILSRGDDHVAVRVPADPTVAPPGPYLLFLIRGTELADRVPSVGEFVFLS